MRILTVALWDRFALRSPGYAGLDIVEVQLPALADAGPAELYIEAGTRQSNRIRIWIEP